MSCQSGACKPAVACESWETRCGAQCVDTDLGPRGHEHCGGCNRPCRSSEFCYAGRCDYTCVPQGGTCYNGVYSDEEEFEAPCCPPYVCDPGIYGVCTDPSWCLCGVRDGKCIDPC